MILPGFLIQNRIPRRVVSQPGRNVGSAQWRATGKLVLLEHAPNFPQSTPLVNNYLFTLTPSIPVANLLAVISLTPKKRFQETEELAKSFRSIVTSNTFEAGITQALAEYTMTRAPTGEQLDGVRTFIGVLLNMAEVEQALPNLPSKHISLSPDLRRKTAPQLPPTKHPTL
jgi:hypothetical protein